MKKSILFPITLFLISSLMTYAEDFHGRNYEVKCGNFNELKVKNAIPVRYVFCSDSIGIATFTADDSVAQALVFENKRGKLTLSLVPRTYGRDHFIPVVTVRSNSLVTVTNEGDSTVIIENVPDIPVFNVKLVGNGNIVVRDVTATEIKASINLGGGNLTINGSCNTAVLNNMGTGTLQAGNLISENVKCRLGGTGNVDCSAEKNLSVSGVGSGTVYYAGSPETIIKRSIGIKTVDVSSVE